MFDLFLFCDLIKLAFVFVDILYFDDLNYLLLSHGFEEHETLIVYICALVFSICVYLQFCDFLGMCGTMETNLPISYLELVEYI